MKSQFVTYFLIPTVAIALLACTIRGPGSSGSTTDTQKNEQYKESYQLNQNGCDTEKHDFVASTQEDLKKQLCEALQNDELNKRCALEARRARFDESCQGHTWNPDAISFPTSVQPTAPLKPKTNYVVNEGGGQTRLTFYDSNSVSKFCDIARLPEPVGYNETFITEDEGIVIVCDKTRPTVSFTICTGSNCDNKETMVLSRSEASYSTNLTKKDYRIAISGKYANLLAQSMAAFPNRRYSSDETIVSKIKIDCSIEGLCEISLTVLRN